MTADQHCHVLGRICHELRGDDAGIGDTGDHRLEAIEVAAKIGETNFGCRDLVLIEDRIDQQIGQRPRCCHRNCLALEIFHLADGRSHHQPVRNARPVAAENLDVGPACAGEDRRSRT